MKRILFLFLFLFLTDCGGGSMYKEDIEKIISENLKSGSSNQEIISFLDQQNWVYTFDHHLNRYQIRNPKEDSMTTLAGRFQIYIYVDEGKSFTKSEVEKVFNAL